MTSFNAMIDPASQTSWEINGVPLTTLAFAVKTWGGNLQMPPPSRGQDQTISYRTGQIALNRIPDARTLNFEMWVTGSMIDEGYTHGAPPTVPDPVANPDSRLMFERNWRMLRRLFWNQTEEFVLTRKWNDDNGILRSASGLARYNSGLELNMTGQTRADFSVEVLMSYPFFIQPMDSFNMLTNATTATLNLANDGDYKTDRVYIVVTGPVPAPFTLSLGNNAIRIQNEMVDNFQELHIDVFNRTAYLFTNGVFDHNFIGNLEFFGNWDWLTVPTGPFTFAYAGSNSGGNIQFSYSSLYL